MIIYLDESYDQNHIWLLISGLFNPTHHNFHKQIRRILMSNSYLLSNGDLKEIKYVYCINGKTRKIYEKVIDAFMASDSYFASVVVKTDHTFDLKAFGTAAEPDKVKRERAYRMLAEHLLENELRDTTSAVLFLDKMTRCEPRQFLEILRQNFCVVGSGYSAELERPRIKHIQDAVSGAEGYELMGVCDLLQGCILNNLVPVIPVKGKKKGALHKNRLRQYLINKLGVKDLTFNSWVENLKKVDKETQHKFNIRYVVQVKNSKSSG